MNSLPTLRILLLTPQLPYPPEQGTSLRNFHIIRGLAQTHELHLLSFDERALEGGRGDVPGILKGLCATVSIVRVPRRTGSQRLRQFLTSAEPDMAHRLASNAYDRLLMEILNRGRFDIVQIEGIELASRIGLIRRLQPRAAIVFDDHNAEAELQRRMFVTDLGHPRRWLAAAYSYIQWRRLQRYERWACCASDGVSVVSDADRAHLQKLAPRVEPIVAPNCIDLENYQCLPRAASEAFQHDILFIGKMDYRPNVDAVLWFGAEIWPILKEAEPSLTWAVVGKQPHRRLDTLRRLPGVNVTGAVPDIKPYLANAKVYVMPFRIGSGTRLKLIEALASGIPTVSTHVGAEGYPLQDGQHILLHDEPAAFAAAVLSLLRDEKKRERLRQAGREFAGEYDWRKVIPAFSELYRRIVSS